MNHVSYRFQVIYLDPTKLNIACSKCFNRLVLFISCEIVKICGISYDLNANYTTLTKSGLFLMYPGSSIAFHCNAIYQVPNH